MIRSSIAFRIIGTALLMVAASGSCFAQASGSVAGLTPSQLAGKKMYVQRCSMCHLPPLGRSADPNPFGPQLKGYLKGPEVEARARKAIREGTPRMPGFQYALDSKEIDDIIAYLKVLR